MVDRRAQPAGGEHDTRTVQPRKRPLLRTACLREALLQVSTPTLGGGQGTPHCASCCLVQSPPGVRARSTSSGDGGGSPAGDRDAGSSNNGSSASSNSSPMVVIADTQLNASSMATGRRSSETDHVGWKLGAYGMIWTMALSAGLRATPLRLPWLPARPESARFAGTDANASGWSRPPRIDLRVSARAPSAEASGGSASRCLRCRQVERSSRVSSKAVIYGCRPKRPVQVPL